MFGLKSKMYVLPQCVRVCACDAGGVVSLLYIAHIECRYKRKKVSVRVFVCRCASVCTHNVGAVNGNIDSKINQHTDTHTHTNTQTARHSLRKFNELRRKRAYVCIYVLCLRLTLSLTGILHLPFQCVTHQHNHCSQRNGPYKIPIIGMNNIWTRTGGNIRPCCIWWKPNLRTPKRLTEFIDYVHVSFPFPS